MNPYTINEFVFTGEVIGVIRLANKNVVKIICDLGSVILEAENKQSVNLGDYVQLSTKIEVTSFNLN